MSRSRKRQDQRPWLPSFQLPITFLPSFIHLPSIMDMPSGKADFKVKVTSQKGNLVVIRKGERKVTPKVHTVEKVK